MVRKIPGVGSASNAYGYYSLTIPAGTYTFNIQYLGYSVLVDTIVLNHDQPRNFVLTPEPIREGWLPTTRVSLIRSASSLPEHTTLPGSGGFPA